MMRSVNTSKGPVYPVESTDVLFGRGNGVTTWCGNITFRHIVYRHKDVYRQPERNCKQYAVDLVMEDISKLNPPGRFLEKGPDQQFYEVPLEKARAKVLQALREKVVGKPKETRASTMALNPPRPKMKKKKHLNKKKRDGVDEDLAGVPPSTAPKITSTTISYPKGAVAPVGSTPPTTKSIEMSGLPASDISAANKASLKNLKKRGLFGDGNPKSSKRSKRKKELVKALEAGARHGGKSVTGASCLRTPARVHIPNVGFLTIPPPPSRVTPILSHTGLWSSLPTATATIALLMNTGSAPHVPTIAHGGNGQEKHIVYDDEQASMDFVDIAPKPSVSVPVSRLAPRVLYPEFVDMLYVAPPKLVTGDNAIARSLYLKDPPQATISKTAANMPTTLPFHTVQTETDSKPRVADGIDVYACSTKKQAAFALNPQDGEAEQVSTSTGAVELLASHLDENKKTETDDDKMANVPPSLIAFPSTFSEHLGRQESSFSLTTQKPSPTAAVAAFDDVMMSVLPRHLRDFMQCVLNAPLPPTMLRHESSALHSIDAAGDDMSQLNLLDADHFFEMPCRGEVAAPPPPPPMLKEHNSTSSSLFMGDATVIPSIEGIEDLDWIDNWENLEFP